MPSVSARLQSSSAATRPCCSPGLQPAALLAGGDNVSQASRAGQEELRGQQKRRRSQETSPEPRLLSEC